MKQRKSFVVRLTDFVFRSENLLWDCLTGALVLFIVSRAIRFVWLNVCSLHIFVLFDFSIGNCLACNSINCNWFDCVRENTQKKKLTKKTTKSKHQQQFSIYRHRCRFFFFFAFCHSTNKTKTSLSKPNTKHQIWFEVSVLYQMSFYQNEKKKNARVRNECTTGNSDSWNVRVIGVRRINISVARKMCVLRRVVRHETLPWRQKFLFESPI